MIDINISVLGDGFAKGIGDPTMLGWAGQLVKEASKELGELNFYNLGIPNQNSQEIAGRVRELVPRAPKGEDNRLILNLGLMDTELDGAKTVLSNQESIEALKSIIVKTRPHFKMLMIGIPPVYDPKRNSRIKRLNGLHRELCQKARLPYIDIFATLSEDVQYKRELAKGGRIYPGEQGHLKVFDLIWNDRSWWFNP
jgi:hypothetical protein